MKIYIPSRRRWDQKFLKGAYHPLRWLTPELKQRTVFVVRDDETERYRHTLNRHGVEVMSCGAPENLSVKRDIIAAHAAVHNEPKFMMCDDDVMLYVRISPDKWNLRYPKPDEVNKLFGKIEGFLDDYAMVGLSPREGNNRVGAGRFPLIRECTRSMRMYAFRTADYLSIEPNRLTEMADFDTTLQLLRSGRKNAVLYYWAQGQPGSQHAGGCSVYRTAETHDKVCRQLQELHPDFVSLRFKENKGHQAGFGKRTEVTVQWQKAFKSSQQEEAA